jgi:hypothetical protein
MYAVGFAVGKVVLGNGGRDSIVAAAYAVTPTASSIAQGLTEPPLTPKYQRDYRPIDSGLA